MEHISAKDYRNQFVEPALKNAPLDDGAFKMAVAEARGKVKKQVLPQPTEHQIQNSILERLKFIRDGFFWRENSGQFMVGEGDNKRFFRAGITGIADIMGVYKGYSVAIEVKRPGKKPSPEQMAFKVRFEECGGIYIVCTDAATIAELLHSALTT